MPSPTYVPVVPNRWVYTATDTDFPVTGVTTQTTTPLAVTLEAGHTYLIRAGIVFSNTASAASAGLSWTGPAGAAMQWNNTTGSTGYRATIGLVDSYTGSTATREAFLLGRITLAATGGNLALTLSTSDSAQTSTLAAGSWLLAERVA